MPAQMHNLRKLLQRQCYTFLTTRWGMALLFFAAVLTLNSVLHLMDTLFGTSIACPHPICQRDFRDNIARRSFEESLCAEPIDAVYTWVNGSDPRLLEQIEHFKSLEPSPPVPLKALENVTLELNGTLKLVAQRNLTGEELEELEKIRQAELDKAGANRYQDNEELRYSLRSVAKYAGWIRNIYIVTNGQIPSWLNLDHPRIHLVTHADIFPNRSHLPVFSSPAIEAHLHRIKGLSRRFVYLNDDTFFGNDIHPDDFYTYSRGFKVYLSWAVPSCAENCPGNWVGDGFCDKPCNVTDCEYDGGDCLGSKARSFGPSSGGAYFPSTPRGYTPPAPPTPSRLCRVGCPNNWLGDKFCDNACKHPECAYDSTDCGMDLLRTLPQVVVTFAETEYQLPPTTLAFYVNLTAVFPFGSQISNGAHDSPDVLRSATISQSNKVMALTVYSDSPRHRVNFIFDGLFNGVTILYQFNLTVGGSTAPAQPTTHPAKENRRNHTNTSIEIENAVREPTLPHRQQVTVAAPQSSRNESSTGIPGDRTLSHAHLRGAGRSVLAYEEENETRRTDTTIPIRLDQLPHLGATGNTLQVVNSPRSTRTSGQFPWWAVTQSALEANGDRVRSKLDRLVSTKLGISPGIMDHAPGRRRLFDMFGDSLKFVNRLLTRKFGNAARKVPAHMTHFIDRGTIERLWEMFPEQWDQTSRNRFRAPTDMQFAFAHYYYIIHAKKQKDAKDFFRKSIDLNGNGYLDGTEVRRLGVLLWQRIPIDELKKVTTAEEQERLQNQQNKEQAAETSHPVTNNSTDVLSVAYGDENSSRLLINAPTAADAVLAEENNSTEPQVAEAGSSTEPLSPPNQPWIRPRTRHGAGLRGEEWTPESEPSAPVAVARGLLAYVSGDHRRHVLVLPSSKEDGDEDAGYEDADDDWYSALSNSSALDAIHKADYYNSRHEDGDYDDDYDSKYADYNYDYSDNNTYAWEDHGWNGNDTWHGFPDEEEPLPDWEKVQPAKRGPKDEPAETMSEEYMESVARVVRLATGPWRRMTADRFEASGLAKLVLGEKAEEQEFKHEIMDLDEVTFFMIRDNASEVQHHMDHILLRRPKFFCVNDNMNYSHPDNARVRGIIHTFLNTYFPLPSPFEHPPNRKNEFLYVEDWQAAKKRKFRKNGARAFLVVAAGAAVCVAGVMAWRRWCRRRARRAQTGGNTPHAHRV